MENQMNQANQTDQTNQTIQLLEECSSGCKIALNSLKQMQRNITNPHFKQLVEDYIGKHANLEKEAGALLGQYGKSQKEPGAGTTLMSWTMAEMKMMMKKGDGQIAKLLMDGCNMGIKTLSQAVNQYSNASKESFSLADCIIKAEEDFLGEAKLYL